jgi:hypothetical protein
MGIPGQGASLYRNLEGIIQFLCSFKTGATGTGAGFRDADTYNAFKNSCIDVHEAGIEEESTRVGFSDIVSCTVTRGGVVI